SALICLSIWLWDRRRSTGHRGSASLRRNNRRRRNDRQPRTRTSRESDAMPTFYHGPYVEEGNSQHDSQPPHYSTSSFGNNEPGPSQPPTGPSQPPMAYLPEEDFLILNREYYRQKAAANPHLANQPRQSSRDGASSF